MTPPPAIVACERLDHGARQLALAQEPEQVRFVRIRMIEERLDDIRGRMRTDAVHKLVGLHDCAGRGQVRELGMLFGRGEGHAPPREATLCLRALAARGTGLGCVRYATAPKLRLAPNKCWPARAQPPLHET